MVGLHLFGWNGLGWAGTCWLAGLAALPLGCAAMPRGLKHLEREMDAVLPGRFVYSDDYLEVELRAGPGSQFRWVFKNKALIAMTIDHRGLSLRRRGDDGAYALWGELKDSRFALQDFQIKPGGFISVAYPIRYPSPFFQLKVENAGDVWLEMPVHWRNRQFVYRLALPPNNGGVPAH